MEKHHYFFSPFFRAHSAVSYLLAVIFSYLFENCTCLQCGRTVYGLPLCRECRKKLMQIKVPGPERCSVCGRILVSEIGICTGCRKENIIPHVDYCFPIHSYRLWNKKLLFAWKIEDRRTLSPFYASLFYQGIKLIVERFQLPEAPVIVPVPPRKGKIRKKGWDQVQEICTFLKYQYGLSVFPCLKRLSKVQQKKLDRKGRISNMGKSYAAGKLLEKAVKQHKIPETVLLIDDVITTGVTIETCAGILKAEGCTKVFALSLFIVD